MRKHLIFLLFIISTSCIKNVEHKSTKVISCDLEKINQTVKSFIGNHRKYKFQGVEFVSTEKAKSGKNSVLLTKEHPFGLTIDIDNVKKDDYFELSVWRFGSDSGYLVASDLKSEQFYFAEQKSIIKDSVGWEKIVLSFHVPLTFWGKKMRVYVWNNGSSDIYFDDIKIVRRNDQLYPESKQNVLELLIDNDSYNKLKEKREEAIQKGLLASSDEDYVYVTILYEGDTMRGKTRLKGDWLDHLSGNKWSFRIKLKSKYSWKGMRTFSVQNPESRYFLNEWFTHKIFEKEDVLTTRYGFVNVKLNGKSLGVYAYEEQMGKNLLEAKQRREGPILKFNESLYWYMNSLFIANQKSYTLPIFDGAKIDLFKTNHTLNSPILSDQFRDAKELLYQYKNSLKRPSDIYDIEKIADFYALVDLTRSHHSLIFHNQRFYFNPILSKLEPIAYDCYSGGGATVWPGRPIFGDYLPNMKIPHEFYLVYNLFLDKQFVKTYLNAEEKYSNPKYLSEILHENETEINQLENLLRTEYLTYKFEKSFYINNAKNMRSALPNYLSKLEKFNYVLPINKKEKVAYDTVIDSNIHLYSIQCFKQKVSDNQKKVKLVNYTSSIINVVGESEIDSLSNFFEKPIEIESANTKENSDEFFISVRSKFLFFKYLNKDKIFSIPITRWSCPSGKSIPRQEISKKYNVLNNNIMGISVHNKEIKFSKGNIQLSNPVYIPAGYFVQINEGTNLNFINKATIISFSPVNIRGTESNPVNIFSSDGTGMGFNIFSAKSTSEFHYVKFNQLNTLNIDGWTLTGAVNLYESNITMTNCSFDNNRCEDALNIVRSNFNIANCSFDNIFSDAFDADFCTGLVANCSFRDIGNDAIDFSGSKIRISNCSLTNANDKAISGGEKSNLTIINCVISYCNIGIASKDLSSLEVVDCSINNCRYGVTAFQKKPEYSEATISLKNSSFNNVNTEFYIEKGSVLLLDSNIINGTETDVAKLLYR